MLRATFTLDIIMLLQHYIRLFISVRGINLCAPNLMCPHAIILQGKRIYNQKKHRGLLALITCVLAP